MPYDDNSIQQHSPFRHGAENGPFFGIYFSAIFLSGVYSAAVPSLTLLTLLLLICFPLVVYRKLRRAVIALPEPPQITPLWIHGITMIACGALITSLLILIYFRWINPDYFADQLRFLVATYEETRQPALEDSARTASMMLENHAIPTPSVLTLGFWLFTVASGSILAGLMAVLVRLIGNPDKTAHNRT